MDRCRRAHEITRDRRAHDGYKDADQEAEARTHARAVLAELKLLGREQQERVAEAVGRTVKAVLPGPKWDATVYRSEEHTSELQSLMRISYAVFCLKKKKTS